MKTPECTCFKEPDRRESAEYIVLALAQGAVMGLDVTRQLNGVCNEACQYLAVTFITLMLRGIAMAKAGEGQLVKEEELFKEMVETLVEDVIERDAVIQALNQKAEGKELHS